MADSHVSGEYLVNGVSAFKWKSLIHMISYVLQEDVFLPYLTVRETLWAAAKLKLSTTMEDSLKKQRVEEIIDKMSLRGCADTVVGDPGLVKGISGGEKKRLAIAVELLTNPSILFLDECTSGKFYFIQLTA